MADWEKKIAAINLIVGDLKRSAAFYREVFGLPLRHEDEDTAVFRFKDTYVFLTWMRYAPNWISTRLP